MNSKIVQIGDKSIGSGYPCYIIVEVGTTHLGDMDKALRLIEAGADAGADAVKFQLIDPDQDSNKEARYQYSVGGQSYSSNMREMFQSLEFNKVQWSQLKEACESRNVAFFATVDFIQGVDVLEELDVPVHKIGGWDITYRPLVEKVAKTGKPVFVDLGGNADEVNDFIDWHLSAGGGTVLFMHDFHTEDERQMNMRAISYLKKKYPWPVGFSSPGRDDDLDLLALGFGANVIEKRLILSRNQSAYHAHQSLEPDEFRLWVERIRRVEKTMGEEQIVQTDADRRMSIDYYRSICVSEPVKKGEKFSLNNLCGKRPGSGIPTSRLNEFLGFRASRDLPKDTLVTLDDLL
jgi:N,N'-diacetyllegionaminate synthase